MFLFSLLFKWYQNLSFFTCTSKLHPFRHVTISPLVLMAEKVITLKKKGSISYSYLDHFLSLRTLSLGPQENRTKENTLKKKKRLSLKTRCPVGIASKPKQLLGQCLQGILSLQPPHTTKFLGLSARGKHLHPGVKPHLKLPCCWCVGTVQILSPASPMYRLPLLSSPPGTWKTFLQSYSPRKLPLPCCPYS